MRKSLSLMLLVLLAISGIKAQVINKMWINQVGNTVVLPTNTSPVGSASSPVELDFEVDFTVYISTTDPTPSTTYPTPYLYIKDWQTGTGSMNKGNYQSTPVNYPDLIFKFDQSATDANPGSTVYSLSIGAYLGTSGFNYPTLMGLTPAQWDAIPDSKILRPTFYIGYVPASSGNGNGVWGSFIVPAIDIWGYKASSDVLPPTTNSMIMIEIDQYQPISMNLEDSLVTTNVLPAGDYTWYMQDQYGTNPYAYTVNNPNLWLNNVYQPGFKPWINSTHVDMTNSDYFSQNSNGDLCYTLIYYVIPTSYVPLVNGNYPGGAVAPAIFTQNAKSVIVQIKPVGTSPGISNPITVASEDYDLADPGVQWRSNPLPASQTNYTFSYNNGKGYLPGDGQYSLAQDIVGIIGGNNNSRPMDWYTPPGGSSAPARKYDHTSGDGTGFMYIVNASSEGGIFYQNTFTVCPEMNLQSSMWLFNICDGTRTDNQYFFQYRIKPNINIQIWDTNLLDGNATSGYSIPTGTSNQALLSYYTGEIPMTGVWEQYITPIFTVPEGVDEITVFYLSVNDGGYGNDFMMDDIEIQRSNGSFNFTTEDIDNCLLATDNYTIDAVWNTAAMQRLYNLTQPEAFDFEWTYYATTDPSTITSSTPGTANPGTASPSGGSAIYDPNGTTTENITLTIPGTQVGTYKLTIGRDGGNLGDACAIYSYYVFSPSQPPQITINGDPGQPQSICPGTPTTLTIDISASNIPDEKDLIWSTVIDGPTKEYVPLLNKAGDRVTGASITVTPFVTTTYAVGLSGCSTEIPFTVNVQEQPTITFESSNPLPGSGVYTRRVLYSAEAIAMPVAYGTVNAGGGSVINYEVYQDSIANAVLLDSGDITQGSTTDSIRINLAQLKPDLDNFRKGINTIPCVITLKDATTGCGSTQNFNVRFISDSTVWVPSLNARTPDDNTNWNNDGNWYITDEHNNRYAEAGIPMNGTHVIIPGDAPAYPILKAAGDYTVADNLPTDDGFNPQPMCYSINFEFGGEVAQLQHLEYLYASVEMNLGTYDKTGTFTNTANVINTDGGYNYYQYYMDRDRYYAMSAPLKEMFSGDFSYGGQPNVYMKYADPVYINTVNPNPGATLLQKWTNSINAYDIPFEAGFGFAYQVLSGEAENVNWPYARNQDNVNTAKGMIRFPHYNNNTYLTGLNPRHTYSGSAEGAGTSSFSYYDVSNPTTSTGRVDEVTRTSVSISNNVTGLSNTVNVPAGSRFIMEDGSNTIPNTFTITPSAYYTAGNEMLLGNPFMSHLDFGQLYVQNGGSAGTLGSYCRIWSGTSAQYYSFTVDDSGALIANTDTELQNDIAGSDVFVAPMQSFFVYLNQANDITFNIENMSVTASNKSTALRSAAKSNKPESLKIVASNSKYSAAAVILNYSDKEQLGFGVPKLFSPSGNIPEIYLVQNHKKEIIEINKNTYSVPLGIRTNVKGLLTLAFHGLDDFSSYVAILDQRTGLTTELTTTNKEYTFMNSEGNQEDRFYLLFTPKAGTEIITETESVVTIYTADKVIKVNSSPLDLIQSVKIFNTQGQLLFSENKLSTPAFTSQYIDTPGVYMVEVKTENGLRIEKIIIH